MQQPSEALLQALAVTAELLGTEFSKAAVRIIKETRGISIDIDNIDTGDEKAYALLRSGFTTGVFQLESSGMRDLAKRIGLQSMEEMSALVALFLALVFTRPAVEAIFLRAPGSMYMQTADGRIENLYTLKLVNKTMRDMAERE